MKASFHLDFQTPEISIASITITASPKACKMLSDTKSINPALPLFLLPLKNPVNRRWGLREIFFPPGASKLLATGRPRLGWISAHRALTLPGRKFHAAIGPHSKHTPILEDA